MTGPGRWLNSRVTGPRTQGSRSQEHLLLRGAALPPGHAESTVAQRRVRGKEEGGLLPTPAEPQEPLQEEWDRDTAPGASQAADAKAWPGKLLMQVRWLSVWALLRAHTQIKAGGGGGGTGGRGPQGSEAQVTRASGASSHSWTCRASGCSKPTSDVCYQTDGDQKSSLGQPSTENTLTYKSA